MDARIALIHATPVAMGPIQAAFARDWPEARPANLLDDSLSQDLAEAGSETPAIKRRMAELALYAASTGAHGILFTCSAFGLSIELAAGLVDVPVLKPNEAMFERAMDAGSRVGMLATFGPSVPSMEREFRDMAAARGLDIRLETMLVEGAMAALKAGDVAAHNRLLAEAAPGLGHCDAIMLAHFSTSQALDPVSGAVGRPVLTSPHAAVAKLKAALSTHPHVKEKKCSS